MWYFCIVWVSLWQNLLIFSLSLVILYLQDYKIVSTSYLQEYYYKRSSGKKKVLPLRVLCIESVATFCSQHVPFGLFLLFLDPYCCLPLWRGAHSTMGPWVPFFETCFGLGRQKSLLSMSANIEVWYSDIFF